jgi:hypothetical protein
MLCVMNTTRASICLALFLAVLVTVVTFGWRSYSPSEQAVYRALAQSVKTRKTDAKVIMSHPSTCKETRRHIDGLPDALVAEFFRVNEEGTGPLRLYGLEGVLPVLEWDLNRQFYARPELIKSKLGDSGLVTLSRVAISNEGSEALLCLETLSNTFSQGSLLHFKKESSGWVLLNIQTIWVT